MSSAVILWRVRIFYTLITPDLAQNKWHILSSERKGYKTRARTVTFSSYFINQFWVSYQRIKFYLKVFAQNILCSQSQGIPLKGITQWVLQRKKWWEYMIIQWEVWPLILLGFPLKGWKGTEKKGNPRKTGGGDEVNQKEGIYDTRAQEEAEGRPQCSYGQHFTSFSDVLQQLLRKKAAEELKREQEMKIIARKRIIEERTGQPVDWKDLNEGSAVVQQFLRSNEW